MRGLPHGAISTAILLGTLARILFVLLAPIEDIIVRSTDDAYYYFNVARHIVAGDGPTFDGINRTNGFHPLWLGLLLPVYAAAGQAPEAGLRGAFVLVALLAGGTFWVAHRMLSALAGEGAARFGLAVLLLPPFLNALLNGLETGLLVILTLLWIWLAFRQAWFGLKGGSIQRLGFGTLTGLMFLARLDSAFIALCAGVFLMARFLSAPSPRPALAVFARDSLLALVGFVAIAAPYMIWNYVSFEHLTPISGALKSTFPTFSLRIQRFQSLHTWYGLAQLAVCGIVLAWLTSKGWLGKPWPYWDRLGPVLVVVAGGCLLHFLFSLAYMNWAAHWWHYGLYLPLTLICLSIAANHLLSTQAQRAAGVGILLAAAAATNYADMKLRATDHDPWYQAAAWVRGNLPSEAAIGMTDCGLFGYFCGRRTVNLDGVINGYEYQVALRDGRLQDYFGRCGLTHVADYEARFRSGRHTIALPARLYRRPGAKLVGTINSLVYSTGPHHDWWGASEHYFAIWPLQALQVAACEKTSGSKAFGR